MSSMAPWLTPDTRKAIRGPVNPLDKATIISILPKEIHEKKPTLIPGEWLIPPGTASKPSRLTVEPSSWFRDVDPQQPLLEIPVSSIQIAKSLVDDYSNGIVGCDMVDSKPGLLYLNGEISVESFLKEHKGAYERLVQQQKNWFSTLLKMADSLWARSNGNPLVISDDMRLAAKELNQQAKDWMKNFQAVEMARCHACGSLRNPTYPVCPTCKSVDMSHPEAKNLKFAS